MQNEKEIITIRPDGVRDSAGGDAGAAFFQEGPKYSKENRMR